MTYREGIEAMRRQWRDREVIFEGAVYTVLDVDYNGALLIDKPDEFKATTAVPVGMVRLVSVPEPTPEGDKPMNPYAKVIRQQLLAYQQQLVTADTTVRISLVRVQISAYKLALETCLNSSFVAMMFEDIFGKDKF